MSSFSTVLALSVVAIATLAGTSSAFVVVVAPTTTPSSSSSRLFANSKNIRAAMDATEVYGISSPQARLAWETVEECDASTNDAAAYTPDEEGLNKMSQEELNQAYAEVQASMEMMQRNQYAVVSFNNNQQLMKDVAAELQAIKLSPPEKKPSPKIPGLWDAKLKARATSQHFGNASSEAKLAWEEVEELASSGLQNAVGLNLMQEETCDLVQAAEACMALEELDRFLYYENYHVGDNIDNNNVDYSSNNEEGGYY